MSESLVKKEEQPAEVATVERTRDGLTYSPRFDIWDTDDELVLKGDLPGVSPENLDIRFENRELTIHGRIQPRHGKIEPRHGRIEPRHGDINFLHGEYGIGDFYRSFTVGETIDSQKISAEMNNGVLTLHLPKTEAVKPRKIEVKSS